MISSIIDRYLLNTPILKILGLRYVKCSMYMNYLYRIGGYFHGKLYSRFADYLSQGSYFRGRKFRVYTRSCPDVSLR